MGSCVGKKHTSEVSKRYLVDDSHFVAVTTKVKLGQSDKSFDAPLCVWVSRGMPDERPLLSEHSKRIVLESWVYLRPNMFRIGTLVFVEMFAMCPVVRRLFEKCDVCIYNKDQAVKQKLGISRRGHYFACMTHVDKVMITLDKVIESLDDPKRFEYLMHELGDKHAEKNVRIEYLDLFTPCFILAIQPVLSEQWASSIEDAWAAFFKHAIHFMKESIAF